MRRKADLQGIIDGVNKTFTLPSPFNYLSGSAYLIYNGITIAKENLNGFTEIDAATILLNDAPIIGDYLVLDFDDGQLAGNAIDVNVTLTVTNYKVLYNASSYEVDYNIDAYRLIPNVDNYQLDYNYDTYIFFGGKGS
jgi:hypothetical protein